MAAGGFDAEFLEWLIRLAVAAFCGMAIGFNRDFKHKAAGTRTLGLVALGACLASLAGLDRLGAEAGPDAVSRVVQGILQGVLTGVGFLGAGVILKPRDGDHVRGLTTAAAVWLTAALGVACAIADWRLVALGLAMTFVVLIAPHHLARALGARSAADDESD